MKLYYAKGACSLAVRIIINELELACDYEAVDIKAKKTANGDDYYKVNPKGMVPVLEISAGEVLTENAIIQEYLADTHGAEELLPALGNIERYRVLEWLNFVSTDLHKSFGPIFNQTVAPELKAEIFIPLVKNKLAFVDKHLANNKYLHGERFTLPDGYMFVILRWTKGLKIEIDDMKNLQRYFEMLSERPSIKKSLQQEGLD